MLFFGKRKGVLFLRRHDLVLFPIKGVSIRFDYPKDAVADLEVIDAKKLETQLIAFVTKNKIKPMQVVIVLSPQTYFQKALAESDATKEKTEMEQFLDEVPFDRGKITQRIVEVDKTRYVYATNKILYETIRTILESLGFEIVAVVPLSAYGAHKDAQDREDFDGNEVKYMFGRSDEIRRGNLLVAVATTPPASSSTPQEIHASFELNTKMVVVLIFSFLLAVGGAIAIFLRVAMKPKPASPVVTEESSPSATGAAQEEDKTSTDSSEIENAKETLTLQVLNGSNRAGMAADVRDRLGKLGFQKIEIGNAKGTPVEETVVSFTKEVPEAIRDSIVADLEKLFLIVKVKEGEDDADFAVEITTGTELINP